jgi:hypothetical protein
MSSLEHRYRRLIALFPAPHRTRYQMEMLSTLMEGAADNQRAPRLRETIDLVWNAIWLRLNRDGAPPARDPRWATAATIFGPLGALVISAFHVAFPLGDLGWEYRLQAVNHPQPPVDPLPFALGGAWLVVAALALAGRYRLAAIPAWLTALAGVGWPLYAYQNDPTPLVREWTLFVLGVTVAGCLTLAKGRIALRARHIVAFGGVTAACAASLWADALLAEVRTFPGMSGYAIDLFGGNFWLLRDRGASPIDTVGVVPLLLFLAFLAILVWLQYSVDRGVRRRLRAYMWVPLITYAMIWLTFGGWLATSMRSWPTPLLLTVGQWAGLILVPPVTFAVAVIVVRRKDSQQRLIEIGRAHS